MSEQDAYPPYSGEDAKCPKCRGSVGTKYYPKNTKYVSPGAVRVLVATAHGDWLLRRCDGCSHEWPEACADAHTGTMFEPEAAP